MGGNRPFCKTVVMQTCVFPHVSKMPTLIYMYMYKHANSVIIIKNDIILNITQKLFKGIQAVILIKKNVSQYKA